MKNTNQKMTVYSVFNKIKNMEIIDRIISKSPKIFIKIRNISLAIEAGIVGLYNSPYKDFISPDILKSFWWHPVLLELLKRVSLSVPRAPPELSHANRGSPPL
jgi:hypothetical protein